MDNLKRSKLFCIPCSSSSTGSYLNWVLSRKILISSVQLLLRHDKIEIPRKYIKLQFQETSKAAKTTHLPWFKLLSRLAMFLSMSSSIFWSSSRLAWWTNLETVGESKFPSVFSGDEYLTSKLTDASIGRFVEGSTRLSSTTTVPSLMRPDASRHGNWRILKNSEVLIEFLS